MEERSHSSMMSCAKPVCKSPPTGPFIFYRFIDRQWIFWVDNSYTFPLNNYELAMAVDNCYSGDLHINWAQLCLYVRNTLIGRGISCNNIAVAIIIVLSICEDQPSIDNKLNFQGALQTYFLI